MTDVSVFRVLFVAFGSIAIVYSRYTDFPVIGVLLFATSVFAIVYSRYTSTWKEKSGAAKWTLYLMVINGIIFIAEKWLKYMAHQAAADMVHAILGISLGILVIVCSLTIAERRGFLILMMIGIGSITLGGSQLVYEIYERYRGETQTLQSEAQKKL